MRLLGWLAILISLLILPVMAEPEPQPQYAAGIRVEELDVEFRAGEPIASGLDEYSRMQVSSDGRRVGYASASVLTVADVASRKTLLRRKLPADTAWAMSPDGRWLAIGGELISVDGARPWRIASAGVQSVFFDARTLFVAVPGGKMRRYDLATRRLMREYSLLGRSTRASMRDMAWQPRDWHSFGDTLFYVLVGGRDASRQCTLRLSTGAVTEGREDGGADSILGSLGFSRNGRYMYENYGSLPADGSSAVKEYSAKRDIVRTTLPAGARILGANPTMLVYRLNGVVEAYFPTKKTVYRLKRFPTASAGDFLAANRLIILGGGRIFTVDVTIP